VTDTPGTPLPTTDTAATDANKVVVAALKAAETPIEAAIIVAEPLMGTPVLKQIWEGLFDWLISTLSSALGMLTGYVLVDAQRLADLNTAAAALVVLQAAQKSGDPNAIAKANQDMDSAVAPILHYVGSINS
jgi:hypothetical protein